MLRKLGMLESNFEIEQRRYLALLLIMFYVKPSIQCPVPFEATINDLGFFHQLRSEHGKSNLAPFCDGFITAALYRLDAHVWVPQRSNGTFDFFFKAVDCQRKRST